MGQLDLAGCSKANGSEILLVGFQMLLDNWSGHFRETLVDDQVGNQAGCWGSQAGWLGSWLAGPGWLASWLASWGNQAGWLGSWLAGWLEPGAAGHQRRELPGNPLQELGWGSAKQS